MYSRSQDISRLTSGEQSAYLEAADVMSRSRWGIRHLYHRNHDEGQQHDTRLLQPVVAHRVHDPVTPQYGLFADHDDDGGERTGVLASSHERGDDFGGDILDVTDVKRTVFAKHAGKRLRNDAATVNRTSHGEGVFEEGGDVAGVVRAGCAIDDVTIAATSNGDARNNTINREHANREDAKKRQHIITAPSLLTTLPPDEYPTQSRDRDHILTHTQLINSDPTIQHIDTRNLPTIQQISNNIAVEEITPKTPALLNRVTSELNNAAIPSPIGTMLENPAPHTAPTALDQSSYTTYRPTDPRHARLQCADDSVTDEVSQPSTLAKLTAALTQLTTAYVEPRDRLGGRRVGECGAGNLSDVGSSNTVTPTSTLDHNEATSATAAGCYSGLAMSPPRVVVSDFTGTGDECLDEGEDDAFSSGSAPRVCVSRRRAPLLSSNGSRHADEVDARHVDNRLSPQSSFDLPAAPCSLCSAGIGLNFGNSNLTNGGVCQHGVTGGSRGGQCLVRTASSSSYGSVSSSRSAFSDCSALSFDDDFDQPFVPTDTKRTSWKMIRNALYWSPFVQQYKQQKIPWIQLAGHQGSFLTGTQPGAILKKLCPRELRCLQLCNNDDHLSEFVPNYIDTVEKDGVSYLQMQDLLCGFECPSVLDCKIGVRTYLEQELEKARKKPTPRKDMYSKMIELDANEPTEDEHKAKAVTKPRYMVWREEISSTCTLGFRIEGLRKWNEDHSLVLKRTKTFEQVSDAIRFFTGADKSIQKAYLERLNILEDALKNSQFFKKHEVIGSSLLFVHDSNGKVGVFMIDFGKTNPLEENANPLKHNIQWEEGNHEDGYLIGVHSLQKVMENLSTS